MTPPDQTSEKALTNSVQPAGQNISPAVENGTPSLAQPSATNYANPFDRWFGGLNTSKFGKLVYEILKFCFVGGLAYLIDIGVFNLLSIHTFMEQKPLTAKIISTIVSTMCAWVGSRYFTFADKRNPNATRELVYFLIVNAIGLGIAEGCLAIGVYALGYQSLLAKNLWGNVLGTGLGTIFRYAMYKWVIFRGNPGQQRE